MRPPADHASSELCEPREQIRALLRQLLQCRRPEEVAGLLARLDRMMDWAQHADVRLAHYLQRRSYQKALEHLDGGSGVPR